jgi:hypothetical protein
MNPVILGDGRGRLAQRHCVVALEKLDNQPAAFNPKKRALRSKGRFWRSWRLRDCLRRHREAQ